MLQWEKDLIGLPAARNTFEPHPISEGPTALRPRGAPVRYKVTKKQQNSKSCLVCGLKNEFGLHTSFFELDNGELLAVFTPRQEHQSYPNRLHGGIASAILDETIGRAIMIQHPQQFGVTVEISMRFKKPVPLNGKLRVLGRITGDSSRFFEGSGEILLADGSVAVEAVGKFLKMPLEKIADFDHEEQQWKVVRRTDDPESVDI
jgi:acyl-coenzyme A thioesterase PaaI-like protein